MDHLHIDELGELGELPRLVSVSTIAGILDLSKSGATKFVRRHGLKKVLVGPQSPRYRLEDLEDLIKELSEGV